MALFNVKSIPNLKLFKQKVLIPTEERTPTIYSVVFVCNLDFRKIKDLYNSKILSHNNKIHLYFIESHYNEKMFNRNVRLNFLKERNELYSLIKKETPTIFTENNFGNIRNRNMFYDLSKYNELFFSNIKKSVNFKKRAEKYLEFLKSIVFNDKFSSYKNKVVAVNVDEWTSTTKQALGSKMDNPISYFYFLLLKDYKTVKDFGNIDFVFYNENSLVKFNPSLSGKSTYMDFKREVGKITSETILDENKIENELKKEEVVLNVVNKFKEKFNFVGDEDVENALEETAEELIEEEIEYEEETSKEELEKKLEKKLSEDDKLAKEVFNIIKEKKVGKSSQSIKRDEELREQQKKLKLENLTLEDIRNLLTENVKLEEKDVSDKVKTTNKNVTKIKYPSFEKAYNNHLYKKDLINSIMHLNNTSIPVYVRDIKVEETSDELNYKETYTVELEDENRVRHKLKFDMPKFIDDKFMYLNGNKKIIIKQLFMKPIVKTGPDEVQVCTNYNKIFLRRHGNKVSAKIEKFKKTLNTQFKGILVKYGNNISINNKYKTTVEYDEISKNITYLKVKNYEFYFNQDEMKEALNKRNLTVDNDKLCVGFDSDKKPILVDLNSQLIGDKDIVDYIMSLVDEDFISQFEAASSGKKFLYTRATVMKKHVPLILLLGYLEGLSTILRKAGIKHYFTDTRPKYDPITQGVVQFSNGYLVYDLYPYENSLLMNAFADIPTRSFEYEEFDSKDAYINLFEVMYNQRNLASAFENFYDFMIDPITKEVLEDLNYPTNFIDVMIYANKLLTDNSFMKENNMNLYRVRSNEIVNAFLYKEIATAYSKYRLTANSTSPTKISIPQDAVIKNILMANNIEDYSILNPIVEAEKSRAVTPKGPSGLNVSEAYTQDKRSYDKTMLGILAMSTSPDANCGIVRQLTLEPNIVSPRGYIDIKHDKLDELTDANLFSPAELLSPLGITRDDSIRSAMATKQSKHIIPVEKSSPVLISNGAEQVIHYHLSNDFTVVAKKDGEVVEVNKDTGIVVVGYYDEKGKLSEFQAIDTNSKVVKNGAGGFYLPNKLVFKLKKGDKFKKDDILAYHEKFFTDSKINGNRFNIGSLQKVACMSGYATYEDSTFITKKLSIDMTSEIVMQKPVVLGKNANVDYMVKVGDEVKVGDDLIRFETSFEDDSLNKFLRSVGDELKEEIRSLGKTPVKSKYTGVIEDIKIYSTVDLDELSPSLRKIVSDYYEKINKKKKVLEKYDKNDSSFKAGILFTEPVGKVETKDGKVKGHEVGEGYYT